MMDVARSRLHAYVHPCLHPVLILVTIWLTCCSCCSSRSRGMYLQLYLPYLHIREHGKQVQCRYYPLLTIVSKYPCLIRSPRSSGCPGRTRVDDLGCLLADCDSSGFRFSGRASQSKCLSLSSISLALTRIYHACNLCILSILKNPHIERLGEGSKGVTGGEGVTRDARLPWS
jgi:hypothetical protein